MQTTSLNWRTLLEGAPVEPVSGNESGLFPDSYVPSSAAGLEMLLHSYEQLYAEKERLRTECRQLRKAIKRGTSQAALDRPSLTQTDEVETGELVSLLRSSIRGIQDGLEKVKKELTELQVEHDPSDAIVVHNTDSHRKIKAHSDRASLRANPASEEAGSGWVLSYPTAEQLRLITSSLINHSVLDERV